MKVKLDDPELIAKSKAILSTGGIGIDFSGCDDVKAIEIQDAVAEMASSGMNSRKVKR